jgi:hypothetical protein
MKSLLLFASVLCFTTLTNAQKKESATIQVPAEVTASLKKLFPETTDLKWSQKKEKYKAEFKVVKTKHEVTFDKAGTVTKHQYEIKKEELPQAVTETITKEYGTYTIHDCERTDHKGITTYKVELKSQTGKKKVNFSSDGKVIAKEED